MAPKVFQWLPSLLTLQTALGNPLYHAPYPTGLPSIPTVEEGKLGAVASESDVCSRIGTELLKKGGNAADAMVGTVACVGVIGMYHSGKSIFLFVVSHCTATSAHWAVWRRSNCGAILEISDSTAY